MYNTLFSLHPKYYTIIPNILLYIKFQYLIILEIQYYFRMERVVISTPKLTLTCTFVII